MSTRVFRATMTAVALAVAFGTIVSAHHSFAMYDQNKTVTLTGVMKQFVPQANHAELHFILLADDHKSLAKGADGKYVEWGVEMAGTAAVAQPPSPRGFSWKSRMRSPTSPAPRSRPAPCSACI